MAMMPFVMFRFAGLLRSCCVWVGLLLTTRHVWERRAPVRARAGGELRREGEGTVKELPISFSPL